MDEMIKIVSKRNIGIRCDPYVGAFVVIIT